MDIAITAIKSEVSDTVKEYAREKISRLDRFYDKARKTDVTIHAEPKNNWVELICHATKGRVFTVHVTAEEGIREAIDLAVAKMGKQLRRFKGKIRSHKGADRRQKLVRDIKRITARLSQLVEMTENDEDDGEAAEEAARLKRRLETIEDGWDDDESE